jgi:hypothetical protein
MQATNQINLGLSLAIDNVKAAAFSRVRSPKNSITQILKKILEKRRNCN